MCRDEVIVPRGVRSWTKSVNVTPLAETLPRVEAHVALGVTLEDGTTETVVNDTYSWLLLTEPEP